MPQTDAFIDAFHVITDVLCCFINCNKLLGAGGAEAARRTAHASLPRGPSGFTGTSPNPHNTALQKSGTGVTVYRRSLRLFCD